MNPVYFATFVNIPRNASTTICDLLYLEEVKGAINRGLQPHTHIICHDHIKGSILKELYNIKDTFTFCFCRNPYDRLVSWFEFHQKNLSLLPSTLTFSRWVDEGCPHHWELWSDVGQTPLLQVNFIKNCRIDFIGRIETFQEDMEIVLCKLNRQFIKNGLKQKFAFKPVKLNKSNRKKLNSYYTPEIQNKVYNYFKEDFSYFGYSKDLQKAGGI